MQELNDGKISDAPFPEKILICVNKRDFEPDIPKYIDSIVDTRGIDGSFGSGREDIMESVTRKDVISIMCDEIASFYIWIRHSVKSIPVIENIITITVGIMKIVFLYAWAKIAYGTG